MLEGRSVPIVEHLLLREAERRVDVMGRFTACFQDQRHPSFITHEVREMVSQRVYSLVFGYEDLNDQESLRHDPLLRLLAGKRKVGEEPLAGKSTLNRLELTEKKSEEEKDRYKKIFCDSDAVDRLLVDVFLESYEQAPASIVLDLHVTDLPNLSDNRKPLRSFSLLY